MSKLNINSKKDQNEKIIRDQVKTGTTVDHMKDGSGVYLLDYGEELALNQTLEAQGVKENSSLMISGCRKANIIELQSDCSFGVLLGF